MSVADRLNELHVLKHTGKMVENKRRPGVQTWVHDEDCAMCLNVAVIAAAEFQQEGWPDFTAPALRDAIDALAARLNGTT